ncbi:MAG: helix-turn-helix transcriptional regulator [Lewinella sp.]|nr:helix-turn-helix transcriptional regulator [Lewinella sp.]
MSQHLLADIGHRLRSLRKEKSKTLTELAELAGVSKSLLSKIENGRTVPSLPVLLSLIQALDMLPETFFAGLRFEAPQRYQHRRPADHQTFEKEEEASGFHYQRIMEKGFHDFTLEAVILDIAPGAERAMVSTDAWEFKYMLQGELAYHIEDEVVPLRAGDSLLYDGRRLHVPRNESNETARMLVLYIYDKNES